MKIYGKGISEALVIEPSVRKPGNSIIRFRENITEDSCDEYILDIPNSSFNPVDITANFSAWLEQAKLAELRNTPLDPAEIHNRNMQLQQENVKLRSQVQAQTSQIQMLQQCIVEMAQKVYN